MKKKRNEEKDKITSLKKVPKLDTKLNEVKWWRTILGKNQVKDKKIVIKKWGLNWIPKLNEKKYRGMKLKK
jgi:hypothetical protein